MSDFSGVLPNDLPQARIERVDGAIMRPPREGDMGGLPQICGVFRPDGTLVELSKTVSIGGSLSPSPPVPEAPSGQRDGAWLFGGQLYHHFGHGLIYSASRLWAIRRLLEDGVPLRGILFHERHSIEPKGDAALPRNLRLTLDVFQPGIPVVTTGATERVETLYVPQQGLSTHPSLFLGLEEQRRFLRDNAARIEPNAAPRDIYISRTRIGWKGNHLFESEIERALAAAGYHVFHPQQASLADQIATYRSARRLIAVDGSALHVAATAIPASARVAIISRREFYAWALADQLHAFSGCEARVIEAHRDMYVASRGMGRNSSWFGALVSTDFARLGQELVRYGFLETAPDWQVPTDADLSNRLAAAKAKLGDDLVRVPEDVRSKEPFFGAHHKAMHPL
ncbi:glycosyltransferase 61 family protein [Tabrizicola sp. BL-A-41-H6]|uniref:glycosyltransferase 61 family protein n=1 Tax=Tabrizicola sp. BL-A-41-H6 TaxID=3421107 RepID=UPI003D6673AC